MGRELKRVDKGFQWPQGEAWTGYLNPYYDLAQTCFCDNPALPCDRCKDTGRIWTYRQVTKQMTADAWRKADANGWISAEDQRALFEAWTPTDPPAGDGYQLWETTSEGSPVSPVFDTLDELCAWAEKFATTFGSATATKEQWREMFDENFVYHREGNLIFL